MTNPPPDTPQHQPQIIERNRQGSGTRPDYSRDTSAHQARVYDYLLGGKDNQQADRQTAEAVIKKMPLLPATARLNRAFLTGAVTGLAERGIAQFIDIGCGLPTQNNTHQAAHSVNPDAAVAYIDNDPEVISHARALLASDPRRVRAVEGDFLRPEEILASPELAEVIDLGQPAAVLLVAVLHFIGDDDDPSARIKTIFDALPSGSYLIASHVADVPHMDEVVNAYKQQVSAAFYRDAGQLAAVITGEGGTPTGLEPVDPGIVTLGAWLRNADPGARFQQEAGALALCGVAVKN